jgi:hypothetical protein
MKSMKRMRKRKRQNTRTEERKRKEKECGFLFFRGGSSVLSFFFGRFCLSACRQEALRPEKRNYSDHLNSVPLRL